MPQFEAMTLTALGQRPHDYGRIRVWGSIGFLLVAASYGWLLDRLGDVAFPWLVPAAVRAHGRGAWPHRNERPTRAHRHACADAGHLWNRPGVRRFLLVALLMQMGFGAFYVFYTLHLQAQGHDGLQSASCGATGVLIEIVHVLAGAAADRDASVRRR